MSHPSKFHTITQKSLISKTSLIILVVLILAQIIVANQLSTSGVKLTQLQKQTDLLNQEIYTLNQQIITNSSIDNLSKIAEADFYVTPKNIINIEPASRLAALNQPQR